ncbi:50S ribosomal protein L10 [Patescibacteria group bacterium]|nr:50S ribosomal protein L10 [Patescibacteria group bacterium]MBU4367975.1 50S ribosomal protein L10 [Patescibacteria group bacterium]MBU4462156.1 50S ribosomal protein L10 [Patescibacteria group bacterium]MCG2699818.1 50S ribosomal protein L10 [Candidatus Parcubacteria bacterium]
MALTKDQKKKTIEDLKEKIKQQKSVVFIDFSKVNSKDIFALRRKLKEVGCILKVAKKTLLKIAFGDENKEIWQKIKENTPGQLAIVLSTKDEISGAKITDKFSKESENVKILGGIFETKFIDKNQVLAIAQLPSKEELLARLVGSLSAPVSGFMNVLQGNIKGLVYALSAIKKNNN